MCEYCGCQNVATIAELTLEHDAVVAEISRVRPLVRNADAGGAAVVARRISEILGPHTAVEEHGLFPHLAYEFPDHIAALEREHREVGAVLGEARDGTPEDQEWPARLLAALEGLREHILKEQDGLFPATLMALDADAWAAVEAVRLDAGSGLARPAAAHDHGHGPTAPDHQHPHEHPTTSTPTPADHHDREAPA